MKNLFTLFLLLISISFKAQNNNLKVQDTSIIICPNNIIYIEPAAPMFMVPGNTITAYDPAFSLSSSNPSQIGISLPTGHGGLALGPNINSSTIGTTFYTEVAGQVQYWDGSSWIPTGHLFPSPIPLNLGMGGNYLYGLATTTAGGVIYKYDGTSNPVYLTTVSGWNMGGPFDLSVDCNGNWSILKADGPQWLRTYDPSGNLLIQYSISGLPISSQGGGLAILNNKVYAHSSNSLAIGTISGSTINFTTLPWANPLVGDFAVCPDCSISTNLENLSNDLTRVFPNPSNGRITIKHKNTISLIEVFNVFGEKQIEVDSHKSENIELDLSHLNNGIYFIHLSDGNIKRIEKIVVNK